MHKSIKLQNTNEKGISLIALIITIIVIIILAAIVIGTALTTPESANRAKFVADLSEVQQAVSTQLASNYNQYITNPDTVDLNAGFTRVSVIGAPESFNSFTLIGSETGTIGYLVKLDTIKMEQLTIGQDYKTATNAVFDAMDAFVYDNEGEVFYLKGYKYQDKIYYSIADFESGGISTGAKDSITFNLANNTEYGLSKTELDLSGEYEGVTVELIKDATTLSTADGSLVLPYSFVGKEPGAYTVRAFGANYTANEITINLVDTIENVGTEIEIYTKEQLANIGKGIILYANDIMYNGEVVASRGKWNYADTYTYKIMADIDLSSITNWEPLPEFKGSLQGNNFTISNLKIDRGSTSNVALISKISGAGEVRDLKLRSVNIKGASYTAGLVGVFGSTGTTKNCSVTGTVQGLSGWYTAGLIGAVSSGIVEDCYSQSTVSGPDTVGGLIGKVYSGIVRRCYSNSTVSGTYHIGGLVGRTDSNASATTISECYSEGNITGTNNAGGFIGWMYHNNTADSENHIITNCYSKASVNGTSPVGGFAGSVQYGSINNCYAAGNVISSNGAGGFVGSVDISRSDSRVKIEKCYSLGDSSSSSKDASNNASTGGFAGAVLFFQSNVNYIKMNNNYSFGNATNTAGANCIGGFIGLLHVGSGYTGKLELINNYSIGKPTTTGTKGGFISTISPTGTKTVTYTYNFWDSTTSATTTTVGSAAYKTTAEMKTASTFSNWNSTIWNIVAGQYPTLKWDFTNVWNQVSGGNHTLKWQ